MTQEEERTQKEQWNYRQYREGKVPQNKMGRNERRVMALENKERRRRLLISFLSQLESE